MSDNLFEIPETPSPRLQWMRKHGVKTEKTEFVDFHQPEHAWKAESAGMVGVGPTEDDAIVDLAKKNNLKLWNES